MDAKSGTGRDQGAGLRVLRVFHGAAVGPWRERERQLRAAGVDVLLVSARHSNEGGQVVRCQPGADEQVVVAHTLGSHPALLVYDPLPIVRALRRGPWDLLDFHEEPYSLATAELRLLRFLFARRVPYVLYTAQNVYKRYPWPIRLLEHEALRHAAAVYPCSRGAKEVIRRKHFIGHVDVLPLGVDLRQFASAPGAAPGIFRIGFVGRLQQQKGLHVLLHALACEPGWTLEAIGDGPDRGGLADLAGQLGLAGRVSFVGALPNEELPARYRRFDVLVVPSLDTPGLSEQFCRVAVEAMATGVPVVASHVGNLGELLDGCGLLVPPGDAKALHSALLRIAQDRSLHNDLTRRGIERSQRFAWSEVARAQAELYRKVVSRP